MNASMHDLPRTPHPGRRCAQCGYDLRASARSGRCPECGAAFATLHVDDPLGEADPRWLARLVRGSTLLAWAVRIAVPAAITLFVLDVCANIALSLRWQPWPAGERIVMTLAVGLGGALLAAAVMGAAGAWLFTSSEPGYWGERRMRRLRLALRVACGLVVAATAMITVLIAATPVEVISRGVWPAVIVAINAAVVNAAMLGPWMAHLIRRVPDEHNLARLYVHQVIMIGFTAVLDLSFTVLLLASGSGIAAVYALVAGAIALVGLSVAVLGISNVVNRARRGFSACLRG